MHTEMGRLASFESISTSIPTVRLVTCGFYYNRRTMTILCSGCGYTLCIDQQRHSVDCRWRNSCLYFDSSSVETLTATSMRVDTLNIANQILVEPESVDESLRSMQISYSSQSTNAESRRVHFMCTLRYFITHGLRPDEARSLSRERHFDNTRVVNYERGHPRNEHDRICLKNRAAISRWASFLSLWQRRQLETEILTELHHLCFMLSCAGFFLLNEQTGGTTSTHTIFRLELACSFCKRIILLPLSFENSAEEILTNLLQKHRVSAMTCPTCLNLKGIL